MTLIPAASVDIGQIKVEHDDKVTVSDGKSFQFADGGKMTVSYNDKNYEYSSLSKVDFSQGGTSISKNPQVIFGDDGLIKEAYFTTGREGEYALGNEIVNLPAGSKVVFVDGKANIQIPGDTIKPPTPVNSNEKGKTSFTYFSEGDKGIKYGEYVIKGGLGWENGGYFIQNQKVLELGDFVVGNPDQTKTFIDFKGEINNNYPSAYISFDKTKGIFVLGANNNVASPSVMFKKDNAYGLKFDSDKDYFAIKAYGNDGVGYVKIKKSAAGIVPEVSHLNDFLMDQDGKAIFYSAQHGKMFLHPNGNLIKDFGISKTSADSSTVAVSISESLKTVNGKQEKAIGDYVVGVSNFNEIGMGKNKRFIRLRSYKGNPAFFTGVSDLEAYNYELTEVGFERLTGIRLIANDGAGSTYLSKPENIRYLYDLLASIPIEQTKMLDNMYFHKGFYGKYAYAEIYNGRTSIHMTVGEGLTGSGNALSAGTWRHEMGHIVDFSGGRNKQFDRMWYNSGIDSHVIVSGYAHNGGERISEFIGDLAYKSNNGIKEILGQNWQNNKWYRAAFAVGWYNYGFTHERVAEIFSGVGLPYDENSLYGYMREVGINVK
jgi:hypothetical protein